MIDFEDHIARTLNVEQDTDSHTEPEPSVFHPSQLARCERQAVISKYGLEGHDTETLGRFHTGTLIHEWLEETLAGRLPGVEYEKELSQEYEFQADGKHQIIKVVGQCDVYDRHENAVYDFKTRNGWYKFDPPVDRHVNQLSLYMDALDADKGQIVYLNKSDLEVKTWPENEFYEFEQGVVTNLINKAKDIKGRVEDRDIESHDDVPFEPCGCWLCNQEDG